MGSAEENADDFMRLHRVEITFHQAGSTDAVLVDGGNDSDDILARVDGRWLIKR